MLLFHQDVLNVFVILPASDERSGHLRIIFIAAIIVFELPVRPVPHHEQVALELLLLVRVELTFLIVTVILFFLSVLPRVVSFIIVTETCIVGLLALSHASLSITKVCLREVLIGSDEHLLLGLLRGDALPIELICVELHNGTVASSHGATWLDWIGLRLVLVLGDRGLRWLMSWPSLSRGLFG